MKPSRVQDVRSGVLLVLLSSALFFFNLAGYGLIDPDEPFYALTAKEMIERRDPMTPVMFGSPQFEKPILFYWALYASFGALGVNEFAARAVPAAAGMLSALAVYALARALLVRPRTAFLAAVVFASCAQTTVLSRLVLTDSLLCFFTTASLAAFAAGFTRPERRGAAWPLVFVFAALGTLTKGPLGALIPAFSIGAFLVLAGRLGLLREMPWGRGLCVFAGIAGPWYAWSAAEHGSGFLSHFFVHENVRRFFVAEHRGLDRWYVYPGGFLLGIFPWAGAALAGLALGLRRSVRGGSGGDAVLFASAAFWTPYLFFSLAESKLLSYPFPAFPAAAVLAALWIERADRAFASGARPSPALVAGAAAFHGAVPPAVSGLLWAYAAKEGLRLDFPCAAFGAAAVFSGAAAVFFVARGRVRAAAAAVAAGAVVMTLVGYGWLLPAAAPAFSSKDVVRLYRERAPARQELLLGSKMVFRGVAFYSGAPARVFAEDPRRLFYTTPPAPAVSTAEDLERVPASAFPLYAVLRDRELEYLRKLAEGRYALQTEPAGGRKSLVRIERVR